MKSFLEHILEKLFLLGGVFVVLFPTNPINMPFVYRDSGVFLYIGQRVLRGELPYGDIWDHKPPLIYGINALGLTVSNQSRWGVWLIEFASLFLAALLGFYLLKKMFGLFPAVVSSLLWLFALAYLLEGGNLTSEYALPLQFAALCLLYGMFDASFSPRRWFLIGLSGAAAFFTKQTTVGIWIAIGVYFLFIRLKQKQSRLLVRELLSAFGGIFVISALILIFFGLRGGLAAFWDAAFRYNFIYSAPEGDFVSRLNPIFTGVLLLGQVWLIQLAVIGYGIALLILLRGRILASWRPILEVGLIALPVEWVLVSISGKSYPHYYISLLPIMALFSGLAFWGIFSGLSTWNKAKGIKPIFQASILLVLVWSAISNFQGQIVKFREIENSAAIHYIESVTQKNDTILLWGAETAVLFYAERTSPTRFVYQYPLYKEGYTSEEMILKYLDDLIEKRPLLIIDTQNPLTPMYEFPIQTEMINEKVKYLQAQYHGKEILGNWLVYQSIESRNQQ